MKESIASATMVLAVALFSIDAVALEAPDIVELCITKGIEGRTGGSLSVAKLSSEPTGKWKYENFTYKGYVAATTSERDRKAVIDATRACLVEHGYKSGSFDARFSPRFTRETSDGKYSVILFHVQWAPAPGDAVQFAIDLGADAE